MPWNPDLYHKFQTERFAPFADLLRMVTVKPGLKVIDLGCGTGELTQKLFDHLPDSEVVGVDSSAEMLAKAEKLARPGLSFEQRSIEDVVGEWDLVFSHAAIQWVDNHHSLIPRLLALVRPGGQLAVQLPSNHHHPSHAIIRELAAEDPFRTALDGWIRLAPVLTISEYAELLFDHGGSDIVVFEKAYPHVLADSDALAEWTSGTVLVPYFERLPSEVHEEFLNAYRSSLKKMWPDSPVFYPFQRILFRAQREAE
jgi:trans-aconitate 2-methyltransferase